MTLPFLERMKERQKIKRRMEAGGPMITVGVHIDGIGILSDETGDPCPFEYNEITKTFKEPARFNRVREMMRKIHAGDFGPCHLPNRQDYYAKKSILKPL